MIGLVRRTLQKHFYAVFDKKDNNFFYRFDANVASLRLLLCENVQMDVSMQFKVVL